MKLSLRRFTGTPNGDTFLTQAAASANGGRNIVAGAAQNDLSSGAEGCIILGGGFSAFPNVINGATPDLCSIVGGYDNTILGVLANSIVTSYHSVIGANVTHGAVVGGSTNQISGNSDYGAVVGGSAHNISGDYAGAFCGNAATVSGNYSVALGGTTNIVAGSQSVVGGSNSQVHGNSSIAVGATAVSYGTATAILGGSTHNLGNSGTPAHGDYSAIVGGLSHVIGSALTSRFCGIVGGRSHTVSNEYQAIVGGQEITLASQPYQSALGYRASGVLYGAHNHAAGYFAVVGDAQYIRLIARISTTDATPTQIRLDGSAQRLALANNTSWTFSALLHARRTDSAEFAGYRVEGVIYRGASAATTTLLASSVTVIGESDAAWNVAASADTTNGALALTVTGAASATIRWVAKIDVVQAQG